MVILQSAFLQGSTCSAELWKHLAGACCSQSTYGWVLSSSLTWLEILTVRFDVSGLTTYMKNHLFFSGKSYHIDKPCAVLVALWHFFILLTNVTGVLWQNCLHLGGASVRWGALGNRLYYQNQLLCSLIWMMLSLHFPKCESAWPYTFSPFGVKKANSNSSGQGREKYILNLFWVIWFPSGLGGFGSQDGAKTFLLR